jgi:hypothetical protein
MISVVNFAELSLRFCEASEGLVFQKVLIAAFSSEDVPLLQPVFRVFLSVSANFDHLVFIEAMLLR